MRSFLRLSSIALTPVLVLFFGLACGRFALAQQATAPPSPTPPPSGQSSVLGNEYDGKWHTDVTPYIWVPTLNGTFHLTNTSKPPPGFQFEKIVDFNAGPNKYLSKLNSALMFTAEFRKGDSAFFTDFIYLNLTSSGSITSITGPNGNVTIPLTASASSRVTGTVWTAAISPSLGHGPNSSAEAVLGFRYTNLSVAIGWTLAGPLGHFRRSGSASQFTNVFAPIIGLRGRLGLGEHWFVPYYADYGSGSAIETYQFILGAGYASHSNAITLVWRQLEYNGTDPSAAFQSIRMGGPTIGYTFRF